MKVRRVLPFVLVFAVTAGTAYAGVDVTVEFQHAPPTAPEAEQRNLTPRAGTALTGAWKVVVKARAQTNLRSFAVSILPTDAGISPPSKGSVSKTYPLGVGSDQITLDWDTNTLTPYNGNYRIVGVAESHAGAREEINVTNLKVNNPPAPPTGLSVRLVDDVPSLSWDKSPEPDITGYSIFRSDDGGEFKQVGASTTTSFTNSGAPKGTQLRYRITATRKSPVNTAGVSSPPGEPSAGIVISTGVAITVPTTASTPAPAPLTAPMKEGTHRGFSETLPLEGLPEAAVGVAEAEGAPPDNAVESILTSPARLLENTVRKLPYIAGAVLMLVSAMHLLRFALRLMRSVPEATPILE